MMTAKLVMLTVCATKIHAFAPLPSDRAPATRAIPAEALRMRAIIDRHFDGVEESADVFTQVAGDLEPSWRRCSRINYSNQRCFASTGSLVCEDTDSTNSISEVLKELGVSECFTPMSAGIKRHGLCPAVDAFLHAFDELTTTFRQGPAFANHALVAWNETNAGAEFGPYNSWHADSVEAAWATDRCENASRPECMGDEASPGKAVFLDLGSPYHFNAVTGWGLCDIARTVLQQNANQAGRNTCAPTATLSSLSVSTPVYALRKATELFWTGSLTKPESKEEFAPCGYVYAQKPGLIRLVPPKCDPTSIDCQVAENNREPQQAVGLEWY